MLVRFLEKNYTEYDKDTDSDFICGTYIEETYDRFTSLIDYLMINDKEVILKGESYLIDDYALYYQADEGSVICLNVYVVRCV